MLCLEVLRWNFWTNSGVKLFARIVIASIVVGFNTGSVQKRRYGIETEALGELQNRARGSFCGGSTLHTLIN
jgi:hypothetical protein